MYPVDERDRVVEIQGVPQSSVGAPLPIILSDEHKLLLAYVVQDPAPGSDNRSVRIVEPGTIGEVLALIEVCSLSLFHVRITQR